LRSIDPAVLRESWFESFKIDYLAFPNAMHDDQLDSLDLAHQVADVSRVAPAFAFGPPGMPAGGKEHLEAGETCAGFMGRFE